MSAIDIYNVLGLIIGIIGVILSLYFYVVGKQTKELSWVILSNNLVEDYSSKLKKLDIKYNNKPVKNLTISHIAFWNKGNKTIDNNDLKTINPIKIASKSSYEILDIIILKSNNISNNFQIKKINKSSYQVLFDYLDHNNGAVFKIVHTGLSSTDIGVIGDIKGTKTIKQLKKVNSETIKSILLLNIFWLVFFSSTSIYYLFFRRRLGEGLINAFIFLMYIVLVIKEISKRIPSGMEPFFDQSSFLYKRRRLT